MIFEVSVLLFASHRKHVCRKEGLFQVPVQTTHLLSCSFPFPCEFWWQKRNWINVKHCWLMRMKNRKHQSSHTNCQPLLPESRRVSNAEMTAMYFFNSDGQSTHGVVILLYVSARELSWGMPWRNRKLQSLWRKPAALLCWLLSARRMFLFLLSATDWVECRGSKGRDGTVLIALRKGGRLGFEDEPGFWATSENKGITKRKKKRVGNVFWVTTILGPPIGVEDRPSFLQFCHDHSQVMRLRNSSPWIPNPKWLKSVQLRTQQIKKYFLFPFLSHCCQ